MGRTRIVHGLRILLPLVALAILSMLFLLARHPDPDAAIPYVQGDAADGARAPGMSGPRFSTVTPDGAVVTFSAAQAGVTAGGGVARRPALDWRTRDGLDAALTAGTGTQDGGRIVLSDGVDLTLSSGWRLTAPRIEADTDESRLTAPDAVSAAAPFGTVQAGGMVLSRGPSGAPVLELNRGVRLLYRPLSDPAPAPATQAAGQAAAATDPVTDPLTDPATPPRDQDR